MSNRICVKDIAAHLSTLAPPEMRMDFDNVGHLVGDGETEVSRVMVALDITDEVLAEASAFGAELIVSHHPLFFSLQRVTAEDRIGRKIIHLLSRGMSAICMHTNLDAADGGVNDVLADRIGLRELTLLEEAGEINGVPYGIGRVGRLPVATDFSRFLSMVKEALGANGLRYYDAGRPVERVAVVGGSGGGSLAQALFMGCDTLLTADIKYDVFLSAKEYGINLIDGDHFCTEQVICPVLQAHLAAHYPQLEVAMSSAHHQTAQFFS